MRRLYIPILFILFLFTACEFKLKPNEEADAPLSMKVQRYDRLECRYLTTGDYSALQQMSTDFPRETRTLIEDMLQLGEVNDSHIYERFLNFYQDTTLQVIIADVEQQYADMEDINKTLSQAFSRLEKWLPDFEYPVVYTQVGALNQSIVVGDHLIGISLDKYLGADYPAYAQFYEESQRQTMQRANIVPDCLVFYLLSLYPLNNFDSRTQEEKDLHMGKVMWVANQSIGSRTFDTPDVKTVDSYMRKHPKTTILELLNYQPIKIKSK